MARKQYGFIALPPMKQKYTPAEWAQREQEYIDSINSIVIPYEPDDADITSINAMIDSVYTIAKIEQAIYTRLYDRNYQRRKNSETEVYLIVKRNLPVDTNGNPIKATETELKARGVEFLNQNKVDGSNYNIYQLESLAADRKVFMDGVVDILKSKSDKLITDSGALKLAVQINQGASANSQKGAN